MTEHDTSIMKFYAEISRRNISTAGCTCAERSFAVVAADCTTWPRLFLSWAKFILYLLGYPTMFGTSIASSSQP